MKAGKLVAPKLVYGVGINDADYAVQKFKTIEVGGVLSYELGIHF